MGALLPQPGGFEGLRLGRKCSPTGDSSVSERIEPRKRQIELDARASKRCSESVKGHDELPGIHYSLQFEAVRLERFKPDAPRVRQPS